MKKTRWRRPLIAAGILCGAAALLAALTVAVALWRLADILVWSVETLFPGARVSISSARLHGLNELHVQGLELRNRQSGDVVLSVDDLTAEFSIRGVFQRRIGEIRLKHPSVVVSPGLPQTLERPSQAAASTEEKNEKEQNALIPFVVERLVCDYGELQAIGFGPGIPEATARFAFDIRNLDPNDAAAVNEIVLWNILITNPQYPNKPFLSLDVIRAGFSLQGLSRQRLDSLHVQGGNFVIGDVFRDLLLAREKNPQVAATDSSPSTTNRWRIRDFQVTDIQTRVTDLGNEIPDISFTLESSMRNASLNEAGRSFATVRQQVEIHDLDILSPYNPFKKVLTLRRVLLEFTLDGLFHMRLDNVLISEPTIYVSEDLFWYMELASRREESEESSLASKAEIKNLRIEKGQLVIAPEGREQIGLPLNFQAQASDIALSNLAALQLSFDLVVPEQSFLFPAYQLEILKVSGDLKMAYPPEKGEQNLVNVLRSPSIHWRQYSASDCWISVTFDKSGITGFFGGNAYGGYIDGGFTFIMQPGYPWIGWVSGENVDLKALTAILSPQNFTMTGPVDFKIELDAQARQIQRVKGGFQSKKKGRLQITKLDELIKEIPHDWSALRQSLTRIGLETLRDFDYDKTTGNFWFIEGQGVLNLHLKGPSGSRNFEVFLQRDDTREGRWKQKTASRQ